MPRTKPCRRCGRKMRLTQSSAPEPMCHPCRRIDPQRARVIKTCSCGALFTSVSSDQCLGCRPRATPRPKRSANVRGYGRAHQLVRLKALAEFVDGSPCPRCELPMHEGQRLDMDHADDRSGYLGLSHSWCNRARKATTPSPPRVGRTCEWCFGRYNASTKTQRFCGRTCANEHRKRENSVRLQRRAG
jgi:hypothetical protein